MNQPITGNKTRPIQHTASEKGKKN
jgi:hypothetical protein